MPPRLDFPELMRLARLSAAVKEHCSCIPKSLTGWESMPVALKEEQLREIATLVCAEEDDLTLDEYHPDGTYFWSDDAPIAPNFYPYNRCGVWECVLCGRCFVRYTDAGAYYAESRIRILTPALIVDV